MLTAMTQNIKLEKNVEEKSKSALWVFQFDDITRGLIWNTMADEQLFTETLLVWPFSLVKIILDISNFQEDLLKNKWNTV